MSIHYLQRYDLSKYTLKSFDSADEVCADTNASDQLKYNANGSVLTLADLSTAQTFTNKTLTSPVISGGTTTGLISTDSKVLAADFTSVTSTLTSLTGFSWTVVAGATYIFRFCVPLITQTTNGGAQAAFKLTTATLTSVNFRVRLSTDTDNTGAVSTNFTTTTDQATWFNQKAVVYTNVFVHGSFVVGTGGTIAVQAAQNTTHADTTTITAGAYAQLTRTS